MSKSFDRFIFLPLSFSDSVASASQLFGGYLRHNISRAVGSDTLQALLALGN